MVVYVYKHMSLLSLQPSRKGLLQAPSGWIGQDSCCHSQTGAQTLFRLFPLWASCPHPLACLGGEPEFVELEKPVGLPNWVDGQVGASLNVPSQGFELGWTGWEAGGPITPDPGWRGMVGPVNLPPFPCYPLCLLQETLPMACKLLPHSNFYPEELPPSPGTKFQLGIVG